ncbi:hypothetical protein K456DRAFT_1728678 [Colletotrichum gloeosporioides 23]|nr:hypothetical protein K456DRAFT_1728678 [Colletotrichum gloeosporioides 23]
MEPTMDPSRVLASLIDAVQEASLSYDKIHNINGLPEAFNDAEPGLALAGPILSLFKQNHPNSMPQIHLATLNSCLARLHIIKDIFTTIADADSRESSDHDWSTIIDSYRQIVVPLGKDHKIEAIMLSLLNELRVLTVDKGWRWYERRLGPETAHEFCASIEPSIPDSEFEQKPDPSPDEGVSPDRTLVAMRGKPASLTSTAAVPQVSKRDDATVDPAKLLQATREEDNDERSVMKLLEEGGIDLRIQR